MSELQTLLDKAAQARSQGVVFKPKPVAPAVAAPVVPEPRKVSSKKKYVLIGAILAAALGVGVYLYMHSGTTTDTASLIAAVGKQIALPSDETPTIATVTDPNKLSGQAFFRDARTGDKVLIYSGAGKAILYRPSEQKVIAVGPLTR